MFTLVIKYDIINMWLGNVHPKRLQLTILPHFINEFLFGEIKMSSKFKDITNQRFGRLVVKKIAGQNKYKRYLWLCQCDCGNEKIAAGNDLRRGATKSCGCLQKEMRILSNIKHGLYYTRLHYIWNAMKSRCYNKNNNRFYCYGKRGIEVCKDWKNNFKSFYDWAMENGYADNLSIDRINVNGNYCPENCRWITIKEQERNRTNNKMLKIGGKNKCIAEWGEEIGFNEKQIKKLYNLKNKKEIIIENMKGE